MYTLYKNREKMSVSLSSDLTTLLGEFWFVKHSVLQPYSGSRQTEPRPQVGDVVPNSTVRRLY